MSTLLERMEWVLEHREDVIGGERSWARAAGLKAETHVNQILRRLRKGEDADVEVATLRKLARAAHVSVGWLADGKGGPEDDVAVDGNDRYPNRAKAAAHARGIGEISEGAIRSVLDRQYQLQDDMSVHEWLNEMLREEGLLKRGGAPPGRALGDE